MSKKQNGSPSLVVQSKVESKKGAAFKVVSFGLTEAGVRTLTSKSGTSLSKIDSFSGKKTAAAA